MKISPQITQIYTNLKKIKKNLSNLCNLWASFFNTSSGETRIMSDSLLSLFITGESIFMILNQFL